MKDRILIFSDHFDLLANPVCPEHLLIVFIFLG
jgi:hypothetical protein